MALGALPWTGALLAGLARAWRERRSSPEARLLLSWFAAPLLVLSFSGSKLPAYLLPSAAASALLAAREAQGRLARWVAALSLLGLATAGWVAGPAALGRLVYAGAAPPRPVSLPPAAHVTLLLLALAALAAWRLAPETTCALVAAAALALCAAAGRYDSFLGSPRQVTGLLAGLRAPGEPVLEVGQFNAGLPFYLGERVGLVEVPRETRFEGSAAVPTRVPRDSVAARVAPHGRGWLFGDAELAQRIAEGQGLRFVRVARWREETLGFVTAAR